MKLKALRKKLVFKKETVSDLNSSQMKNVYGYGTVNPPFITEVEPFCTYTCGQETLCWATCEMISWCPECP